MGNIIRDLHSGDFFSNILGRFLVVFLIVAAISFLISFVGTLISSVKSKPHKEKIKTAQSYLRDYEYQIGNVVTYSSGSKSFFLKEGFFSFLFIAGNIILAISAFYLGETSEILLYIGLIPLGIAMAKNIVVLFMNGGFKNLISSITYPAKYIEPTTTVYDVYRGEEHVGTETETDYHTYDNVLTFVLKVIVTILKIAVLFGASYGVGLNLALIFLHHLTLGQLIKSINRKKAKKSFEKYLEEYGKSYRAFVPWRMYTDDVFNKIPQEIIAENERLTQKTKDENAPKLFCACVEKDIYVVGFGCKFAGGLKKDGFNIRVYENSQTRLWSWFDEDGKFHGGGYRLVTVKGEENVFEKSLGENETFVRKLQTACIKYAKSHGSEEDIIILIDFERKRLVRVRLKNITFDESDNYNYSEVMPMPAIKKT